MTMGLSAASLPYVNAVLFALQLIINAKQDAFSPSTPPNHTPDIPLAPAGYAFLIWLVIYILTAAHVFTDCFRRELSLYTASPTPTHLRLCFSASCVLNMLWIVLTNWLQWINVGTIDLILLTASLSPIYFSRSTNAFTWRRFIASELAIRLYMAWVTIATLLCLTMSLQDWSGAYLSFEMYAFLLATLLVLGLCGVVYGEDPVVGLVVAWALVGIAQRTDVSPDPALQHSAELLRACAAFAASVLSLMMVVTMVRQRLLGRHQTLDVALAKPVSSSYQPSVRYGATPAP